MKFLLAQDVAETISDSVTNTVQLGAFAQYLQDSLPTILDFCVKIIIAIIVLLIGRKIISAIRKVFNRSLDKTSLDTGVKQFFDKLMNVFLHFILIILVLSKFGITASTVIAVIGSVGLSIGLALQGALSNFAGGVLILMLRPFKVGDYIQEHGSGKEGTVMEIQLFYTKLVTLDNQIIVLPNSNLTGNSLTNFTHQDKRRVDIVVGVSYQSDIRKAKDVILKTAEMEEKRLADEPFTIVVSELAESSVDLKLCLWTKTSDYWDVKWRLTEEIKYALDENQIQIPFPQVTVSYVK